MSKNNEPKIFIVTPVFNERVTILNFLKSLKQVNYTNYTSVVVDMGNDGTAEAIAQEYPETVVLKAGDIFWSGGTNTGVEYALKNRADFVYTINADVELDPKLFKALIETADEYPGALVGSKICYIDDRNRVWFAGGILDHRRGAFAHGNYSTEELKKVREVEWLTGMGALVPVAVYKQVGLYDTEYFPQYYGDTDLSMRAAEAGFKQYVNPAAVVYGDIASSWYPRQLYRPRLRLLWDTYFSMRSNYNIRIQAEFHKRHWKGNYRLALLNLYARTIPHLTLDFVRAYAKYPIRKMLGKVK